jgi:Xaa-Pro aminopeptidase
MVPIDPKDESNADRALRTVRGENMAPFTEQEYRDRLRRVRQEMEQHQIDTLIVSDPANLCFLSGYQCAWYQDGRPRTWYPDSCIAVRVDADEFLYFEDMDEIINSRVTSVTRNLRTTSGAWSDYFGQDDEDAVKEDDPRSAILPVGEVFPGRVIAKELAAAGWLAGNVALELWSYRPNRGYSELLQQELERAGAGAIVDGSDLVNNARRIKSAQELAYIHEAARITDIGIEAAHRAMRPGVTELDVWAEADYAMAKAGGEHSGIQKMIGSGSVRSHALHGLASRRVLEAGDIINIDLCGVYHRYHSNVARCFSIGEPDAIVREGVDRTNRVFDATFKAMRPGVRVLEFLDAGKAVAEAEGIWRDAWWFGGYELGIGFPPDWVGNFVYDHRSAGPDDTLEPGFVGNHEFNFYLPDCRGIRELIDTFEVTDSEIRWLHKFPKDLVVID